jgi:ABC-type antimicrobial peptide transport system permease subunit
MKLPLAYIARNLWVRRLTTTLTALGMALVVFVFAAVLMLDAGLKRTLAGTGSPENAILIRQGVQTEIQSGVAREQAALIETLPGVARGAAGEPLVSKEIVALIGKPKRGDTRPQNIVTRGTGAVGIAIRPDVRLIEGRWFTPGANEIAVGKSVAREFEGLGLGESTRFAGRDWRVVGVFDAGATGFDSEAWADAEQLAQAFRRLAWSSVIVRLTEPGALDALRATVEADVRLKLDVKREPDFYEEQSRALSTFLNVLGLALSVIFSVGAVIGAAITMYAAVANRVGEIGTLRALGFQRSAILTAFLAESLLLALVGGVAGLAAASTLQTFTVSTLNFTSFSQLAFGFHLTPAIAVQALLFAALMGLVGGFLPALRAARLEIVEALRAA